MLFKLFNLLFFVLLVFMLLRSGFGRSGCASLAFRVSHNGTK